MRYTELIEDRFVGSTFSDDEGHEYSVERAYELARAFNPPKTIPVSKLQHDLEWWDNGLRDGSQTTEHMLTVDTSYPLLVLQMPDGHLSVADGLNRLKKSRDIENKTNVKAYILPWNDEAKRRTVNELMQSMVAFPVLTG